MHLTNQERETIIVFNEAEEMAECYTCNKSLKNKLLKLSQKNPVCHREKEDNYSVTYTFPKKWLKVHIPPILSEEVRRNRANNLIRNLKRGNTN